MIRDQSRMRPHLQTAVRRFRTQREAGCLGTVKMSFESGPYWITRTSINAERFARAIERAHGIGCQP